MTGRPATAPPRSALEVHLELSSGRHGASASVGFHDGAAGTLARIELRGWIDAVAARRCIAVLEDLARRGVVHLEIDASGVRHVDAGRVRDLLLALEALAAAGVAWSLRGLSPHVRDRFLVAGWDPGHEVAAPVPARAHGTSGGWAP